MHSLASTDLHRVPSCVNLIGLLDRTAALEETEADLAVIGGTAALFWSRCSGRRAMQFAGISFFYPNLIHLWADLELGVAVSAFFLLPVLRFPVL